MLSADKKDKLIQNISDAFISKYKSTLSENEKYPVSTDIIEAYGEFSDGEKIEFSLRIGSELQSNISLLVNVYRDGSKKISCTKKTYLSINHQGKYQVMIPLFVHFGNKNVPINPSYNFFEKAAEDIFAFANEIRSDVYRKIIDACAVRMYKQYHQIKKVVQLKDFGIHIFRYPYETIVTIEPSYATARYNQNYEDKDRIKFEIDGNKTSCLSMRNGFEYRESLTEDMLEDYKNPKYVG